MKNLDLSIKLLETVKDIDDLIAEDADINYKFSNGLYPLKQYIKRIDSKCVKYALEKGANPYLNQKL